MKKTMCAIHIISDVITVLLIIMVVINIAGGHTSVDQMKPLIIGFIICSAISGATKKAANRAAEDHYYRMQSHFMEMQNRQAQMDAEEAVRQMTDQQNRQAMDDARRAAEDARLAATGIEFGGYNPDPNLNPGMQNFNNNSFGMF